MRHVICYLSTVNGDISLEEVNELLNLSAENNKHYGIKGLLLYAEGNFFQYIEGEKNNIMNLWDNIKQDTRHYDVMQIMSRDITEGSFDGFHATVVREEDKHSIGLPDEYVKALQGLPANVQKILKRMIGNFVDTRIL